MSNSQKRVVLTGFMGVGKSSVARHLSYMLKTEKVDLDYFIEEKEKRSIAEILTTEGEPRFREIESDCLYRILNECEARIVALGGGAWTIEENRNLIKNHECTTVWLESSFEHCWFNIRKSRKERPLAKDKRQARKLFEQRQKVYCLADWHFIIKPEFNSYEVARRIAEEVFSVKING
jgi:shikimate kinase